MMIHVYFYLFYLKKKHGALVIYLYLENEPIFVYTTIKHSLNEIQTPTTQSALQKKNIV